MIPLNVILRGKVKEIVEGMVKEGYANSQSEAIRLAILNFWEKHSGEDAAVSRKLDRIDTEVASGKRKLLNAKEALGAYSKHLK